MADSTKKQAFFSFPETDSDEKSFYTSSGDSTLTPGLSTLKADKTDSTVTELKLPETGPAPSVVMTSTPHSSHHNGTPSPVPVPSKIAAVQRSTDSERIQGQNSTPVPASSALHPTENKSTSDRVLSAFDSWDDIGNNSTRSAAVTSHLNGANEVNVGGAENVALSISNGQADKALKKESPMHKSLSGQQRQRPPSGEQSTTRVGDAMSLTTGLKPSTDAVPVPAVAAVGVEESDGGRVSRQSNVSASSWEFESFQWKSTSPENRVHSLASNSEREASFDPSGIAKISAPVSSNVPKFPPSLMERRGVEVEDLDRTDFVNVITIGGMSQGDPLALESGWMQGVDREESLGSSLEGVCGNMGIVGRDGWKDDPKVKEDGKKSSAAKKKKSDESASPTGSGKKKKGDELSGSAGKKSKEPKKTKEKAREKESGKGRISSSERTPEKKSESKDKGQSKRTSSVEVAPKSEPRGSAVSVKASDSIRSNPISPSASKPHVVLHKGSASFREGGSGLSKGVNMSGSGLSKASLPNLSSPVSGSSREATPDRHYSSSATSEDDSPRKEHVKQKKEKLPLRKRFSMSMKNLLDRDGTKAVTSKTAWTFAEIPITERSKGLVSAQSEQQLFVLTEKDRESLLADTELIPRTYSMECLHPTDRDPFLAGPGIKKGASFDRVSSDSDSEYLTASDSEMNDYINASISILSTPSDTLTRDAGYGAAKSSLQSVSSPFLPQQSPQTRQLQTSTARGNEAPVPVGDSETTPKSSPAAAKKKRAMTTVGAQHAPMSPRSRSTTTSGPSQSLSSASTPSLSGSSSNVPSSFSRFSKERVPIRKPSVSKSPRSAEPFKSSLSERVERIKQQRRTENLSVAKPVTARKSPTNSPVPSRRATSKLPSTSQSPKSGSPVTTKRTNSVPKSPVASRLHSNSSPISPQGLRLVSKTSKSPSNSSPVLSRTASKSPSRSPQKTTPTGSRRIAASRSPVAKAKVTKGAESQAKKGKEMATKSKETPAMSSQVIATDVSVDIDSLLASVGQQLDLLEVSPESQTAESDVSNSDVRNRTGTSPMESELGPRPVPVSVRAENAGSPPPIASMPAFVFSTASPLHSRQSSYDVDPNPPVQEDASPPDIFVTPNTSPQPPRRVNQEPNLQKPAAIDTKKQKKSPILGMLKRRSAPRPPSTSSSSTKAAAISTDKTSLPKAPRAKNLSPIPQRRQVSTSSSSLLPAGKKTTPASTAHPPAPSVKRDSNPPMQRTSSSYSRTSSFTSALPPKPPSMKKNFSETVLPSHARRIGSGSTPVSNPLLSGKAPSTHITVATSTTQTPVAGRPKPAGGVRATTNLTRPASGNPLRSSRRKLTPSAGSSSSSSSGAKSRSSTPSLLEPKGSLSRSSIRASGRKKISTVVSPKHFPKAGPSRPIITKGGVPLSKVLSPDEKAIGAKSAVNLSLERGSNRGSMKSKSATSLPRPSSASASTSRSVSSNDYSASQPHDTGGKPGSPARHSMRRVSSGEKKIRPGYSGSLNRRERRPSGGSSTLNRPTTGSKSSTTLRPQSATTTRGSAATRSMRLSRADSRRKIIGTGTLPRTSTLTRKATPPSSVAGSVQSSPARLSMRRTQSGKDVFAVFDQISAEAQGSM